MIFFKKRNRRISINQKISWKITSRCLSLIFECAKSEFPKEFGGLLRVDPEEKTTINEIVLLPGTISGDAHAIFRMHMLPIDFSIVGTVHSHPSYSAKPSSADLQLFGNMERYILSVPILSHLILGKLIITKVKKSH